MKPGSECCKPFKKKQKKTEEDQEETQEAAVGRAAAKEISVDAAV